MTILGVVAALTVPSVVHNNQTRINKTRLKKAMATYDRAISQMSVVNRLNNKVLFKEWAEEDNCNNAISYFNIVNSTRNGCKFKTSDGIWWDVTNIDRTLVSFKEGNLTSQKAKDYDDKDAFVLVTSFDDTQGVLRIDDLGYETINLEDNKFIYVSKLYNYITNGNTELIKSAFDFCKKSNLEECKITIDGRKYTYRKMVFPNTTKCGLQSYNRETQSVITNYCSISESQIAYIALEGELQRNDETYDESSSICPSSTTCRTKGDVYQAAINKCKKQGAELANVAQLEYLKNQNILDNVCYHAKEEWDNYHSYHVCKTGTYSGGKWGDPSYKMVCVGK